MCTFQTCNTVAMMKQQFIWSLTQISNQTSQCLQACRRGQDDLLKTKRSIRMWKKGNLSDFERGVIADAKQAGLRISKTADLLGFCIHPFVCLQRKGLEKKRKYSVSGSCGNALLMSDERRIVQRRALWAKRKATVILITGCYNQGRRAKTWSRWATAAKDHTSLTTGNWGHNLHRLTTIGQKKIRKHLLVWWVSISAAAFRRYRQNFV